MLNYFLFNYIVIFLFMKVTASENVLILYPCPLWQYFMVTPRPPILKSGRSWSLKPGLTPMIEIITVSVSQPAGTQSLTVYYNTSIHVQLAGINNSLLSSKRHLTMNAERGRCWSVLQTDPNQFECLTGNSASLRKFRARWRHRMHA